MKQSPHREWNAELAPLVATERKSFEWEFESLKLDIALAFEQERQFRGISYKELADLVETSPAYITKVFRGDSNLTLESMLKFARALKTKVNVSLDREDAAQPLHVCGLFPRVAANSGTPLPVHRAPVSHEIEESIIDSAWWPDNVINLKVANG